MTPEAFQKAHLRGMQASAFRGTVIVLMGAARHSVPDCVVESGDNQAKAEELALAHVRTISAQLPKLKADGTSTLPRRPETKDQVEYKGRKYTLISIEGDDDASAVWILEGNAPL